MELMDRKRIGREQIKSYVNPPCPASFLSDAELKEKGR